MEQWSKPRVARAAVVGSTVIPLVVLCIQSIFLRWYADDFLYAAADRGEGFGGAQLWWYREWSGRFAYTFVATLLLRLGPHFAGVIAIATIVTLVWLLSRWLGLAVSLAAAYTLFLGSPDFLQTAFWFTGMLTYVTPLIGLVWWTFVRLPDENARAADFVLPFFLAGFSEAGALCNLAYFVIAGLAWRRRSAVVASLASLTAFAIIAIAPGNAVRMAMHHQEISAHIARETLRAVGTHFAGVTSAVGFPMVIVFAASALFAPRASTRTALVALTSAVMTTAVVYGVVFAAMGQMPPGRVLVVPHAFLVAAVCAAGARMPRDPRAQLGLTVAVVVSCLSAPLFDSWQTIQALPVHHRRAVAWDALAARLEQLAGRDVVVILAPSMVGTLRFITHDRDDVMNVAVARYYDLRTIAGSPPDSSSRVVDPRNVVSVRWTGPLG